MKKYFGCMLDSDDFFGNRESWSLVTSNFDVAVRFITRLYQHGVEFRIDCKGNNYMSNNTGHFYISNSDRDHDIYDYVLFLYDALIVDKVNYIFITPSVDWQVNTRKHVNGLSYDVPNLQYLITEGFVPEYNKLFVERYKEALVNFGGDYQLNRKRFNVWSVYKSVYEVWLHPKPHFVTGCNYPSLEKNIHDKL